VAVGVLILVALVGIAIIRQGPKATPLPGQPLKELGRAQGIVVGTAVRSRVLKSTLAYRELVAQQFASLTPENEMKWEVTEPERGEFHFGPGDEVVEAAKTNGQAVRGHTLIWHAQYPGWLKDLGPKRLAAATKEHIEQVVGHYRASGLVNVWDVVNEVVADDGGLRESIFLRRLGPGFIAGAFTVARAADPKAKLYINEIGAETIGPKSNRLYELVRGLKAANVPLDGVGFQVHSNLRGLPDGFVANMQRFKALGLEIAITETDVGLKLAPSESDLREQAKVYASIVRACKAVQCASLTFWGFADGHSWISETQTGIGAATLLDERFAPKPAFGAVQDALRG